MSELVVGFMSYSTVLLGKKLKLLT